MRASVVTAATPAMTAPSRTRRSLSRNEPHSHVHDDRRRRENDAHAMGPDRQGQQQCREHQTNRTPPAPRGHGKAGNRPDNVRDDCGIRVVGAPGRDDDRRTEQRDDCDGTSRYTVQPPHEQVSRHDGDQREEIASREKAGHGAEQDIEEPCHKEEAHLGAFAQACCRFQRRRVPQEHLAWIDDVDRVHGGIGQLVGCHATDPEHEVRDEGREDDGRSFADHGRAAVAETPCPCVSARVHLGRRGIGREH